MKNLKYAFMAMTFYAAMSAHASENWQTNLGDYSGLNATKVIEYMAQCFGYQEPQDSRQVEAWRRLKYTINSCRYQEGTEKKWKCIGAFLIPQLRELYNLESNGIREILEKLKTEKLSQQLSATSFNNSKYRNRDPDEMLKIIKGTIQTAHEYVPALKEYENYGTNFPDSEAGKKYNSSDFLHIKIEDLQTLNYDIDAYKYLEESDSGKNDRWECINSLFIPHLQRIFACQNDDIEKLTNELLAINKRFDIVIKASSKLVEDRATKVNSIIQLIKPNMTMYYDYCFANNEIDGSDYDYKRDAMEYIKVKFSDLCKFYVSLEDWQSNKKDGVNDDFNFYQKALPLVSSAFGLEELINPEIPENYSVIIDNVKMQNTLIEAALPFKQAALILKYLHDYIAERTEYEGCLSKLLQPIRDRDFKDSRELLTQNKVEELTQKIKSIYADLPKADKKDILSIINRLIKLATGEPFYTFKDSIIEDEDKSAEISTTIRLLGDLVAAEHNKAEKAKKALNL